MSRAIESTAMESRGRPAWSALFRDPLVLLVLAITLALELGAWRATEGYRLADSVEFMERARALERGEAMIDSVAIRPIGFSTLLVPFFGFARWIGLPEGRAVAWAISLFQVGLGLGLVAVAIRLGGLLAGRRGGLIAGLLAGANPVFLQYSTQPVSGLAAGIFVGLALAAVLEDSGFRPGLRCGLWLGAAFLMAFQSILITLVLLLLLLVRDGIRKRSILPATVGGLACGFGSAALVQVVLDWAQFGTPGASLANYLVQNFGNGVTSFLLRIGLRSLAVDFHEIVLALQGREEVVSENAPLAAKQIPWFYVVELPRMLVWPALAAFVLGLARGLARPSSRIGLPLVALVLIVFAMSYKGSKDFRLWLPFLPWVAAIAAYGWTWIRLPKIADLALAASLLVLGPIALAPGGARRFAGFWRAMDWVDERARSVAASRTGPERRVRAACAYHWAVFLREAPEVELVKLPWQLDGWAKLGPEKRAEDLAALESLDVFAAHLPLLTGNGALLEFLAPRFHVAAAVYDPEIDLARFGPILVLERRTGTASENLLFETATGASDGAPARARFSGSSPDGRPESLELVDWRYARLPPQGLGWLQGTWRSPTGFARDFLLETRITCPDDAFGWQQNAAPAFGLRPTSAWRPGDTVVDGRLVIPATDPFDVGKPIRPLGEEHLARGIAPAGFWLRVETADRAALEPEGGPETSGDGFARIARFDLPLLGAAP